MPIFYRKITCIKLVRLKENCNNSTAETYLQFIKKNYTDRKCIG